MRPIKQIKHVGIAATFSSSEEGRLPAFLMGYICMPKVQCLSEFRARNCRENLMEKRVKEILLARFALLFLPLIFASLARGMSE